MWQLQPNFCNENEYLHISVCQGQMERLHISGVFVCLFVVFFVIIYIVGKTLVSS